MRWFDRRRSSNVIDLRGTKPELYLTLMWQQSQDVFSNSSIVILTDGTIYAQSDKFGDLQITLENPHVNNQNIYPNITIGQINTIRQLIENLLPSYKVTVNVGPGDNDIDLAEIAQNFIDQR